MGSGDKPKGKLSRRDFVKGAAAGAAVAAAGGGLAATARGAGTVDRVAAVEHAEAKHGKPKGEADLALVNGKILTLDDANTVAESVTIRDGRIEAPVRPARRRRVRRRRST